MKQITDHVYGILSMGGFMNYYVIAHQDNLTVIDIALGKGDVDRLERELQKHGWAMNQIKHILITHAHPDHIGGLAELQKRVNAHTMAHRLDTPVIRGDNGWVFANPKDAGMITRMFIRLMSKAPAGVPSRVDTELSDGDALDDILPGLKAVHLPGHSYGQTGYWLEEKRLLIGGDVMMRFPWGLGMPLRPVSPDWNDVKKSIRKVADMNVDILCLGHGQPILGAANPIIRKFAERVT